MTQMEAFMHAVERAFGVNFNNGYEALHAWSIENKDLFWSFLADFLKINWHQKAKNIFKPGKHFWQAQWFEGAHLNYAQHLLSHDPKQIAIIEINEQGQRHIWTFGELTQAVHHCASAMQNIGIQSGDRVVGVLPNNHYPLVAMLACASIGAIWSSCSTDFGAEAIADRFLSLEPKLMFVADGQYYAGREHDNLAKMEHLLTLLPSLNDVVICPVLNLVDILQHESIHIHSWQSWIQTPINSSFEYASLPFSHPLCILFSSGTTGKPKCIIHGTGGTLLQHLKELALHCDLNKKDRLLFFTTCGWMMWNWMISALALGTTVILYDGSPAYPHVDQLFALAEQEKVTVLGTSAKYLLSVEKSEVNFQARTSLDSLRMILSTGSPLLPEQYDFVHNKISSKVHLASISGGTDIISCFALGNPMLPVHRGELQSFGLGMAVDIFDNQGHSLSQGGGELVCIQPFPSMPIGFWKDEDDKMYHKAYFSRFPEIWTHGDYAARTIHGGLIIYGRSDSTLNPGGVRIGTAEIYRQVETIPEILESVVVGRAWQGDVQVILFVKLRPGFRLDEVLKKRIIKVLKERASPRHVPYAIIEVPDIPKTINGKIVEAAVRHIINQQPIDNAHSIVNPDVLEYFKTLEI